ncbi:MAG: GNAT family N-acetyltransferase [Micromonosporaceae bacterium]|nr:GNAT family N-acetyltransferase [Micromonosporaceae bacterium]
MEIRQYGPADQPALYEICLRTGDSGRDATGRYADPRLLGHVYLGAYLALQPRFALVLDRGDDEAGHRPLDRGLRSAAPAGGRTPVGYAVAALDSAEFAVRCEARWWPPLRRRYPDPVAVPDAARSPDQRLAALIHHPPPVPDVAGRYPSQLHIDLLPAAQGGGHGRALLSRLTALLAAAGSSGVHAGVDPANRPALGFYRRLGFEELAREPGVVWLGADL